MTKLSAPTSVSDLIEMWPSATVLASDIGEPDATVVRMWKYRQRIPAEYDVRLVGAAKKRSLPVNFELLAKLRDATGAAGEKQRA